MKKFKEKINYTALQITYWLNLFKTKLVNPWAHYWANHSVSGKMYLMHVDIIYEMWFECSCDSIQLSPTVSLYWGDLVATGYLFERFDSYMTHCYIWFSKENLFLGLKITVHVLFFLVMWRSYVFNFVGGHLFICLPLI